MQQDIWTIINDTPRLLLRANLHLHADNPEYGQIATPIYVPEDNAAQAKKLLPASSDIKTFNPATDIHSFYSTKTVHGLLYLPYPYLVPGGRFNEMYGWDTAFPVFAWAGEHPRIMREQIDNHTYQIHMYGKILNTNRTYHLSRSQPPFIAAMTWEIWQASQNRDWKDFDPDNIYTNATAWLTHTYSALEKYYTYWTTGDRLANGGPLSRYWDDSDTPAPEVITGEKGHFEHARTYFSQRNEKDKDHAENALFYDQEKNTLTPLYYRADRSMRASGFDPTGHWGYGALRCMFHAPICLNALLYKMEEDMEKIATALHMKDKSQEWKKRKHTRNLALQELLYDPETSLFHDYDFIQKKQNKQPFATIFHAMWAGLYDDNPIGATKAVKATLKELETPYGICTSNKESGSQWDAPYGWPPLQYIAIMGLYRCGFTNDARRIAKKYLNLATRVFAEQGTLFEKYNVKEGNANIHVINGYNDNAAEKGTFLWTAATLKMAKDFLAATK